MERFLKCFNKSEHETHTWTFQYDNPATVYTCPGRKKEEK